MQNEEKKIALKLQKMQENDLTKKVIIPLLESLTYHKVEFHGGVSEEGKDIICWEDDKFGDLKLTVAQVKHFKFTNTASDSKSLQTIFNQLTTCFAKPLIYTDKSHHLPSEALLITTYPIDTKTLQTRFGSNPQLKDSQIKIIDGIALARLLVKHKPDIVKDITGIEIEISSTLKSTLNNSILLRALGFHEKVELQNIYTDIDFSIGKRSTELFFNASFKPVTCEINLNFSEWDSFKNACEEVRTEFTIDFLNLTLKEIEFNYQELKKQLEIWKPKYNGLVNQKRVTQDIISSLVKESGEIQKLQNAKEKKRLEDLSPLLISKSRKAKSEEKDLKKKPKQKETPELLKIKREIEFHQNIEIRINTEIEDLVKNKPNPVFKFILDGVLLAKLINEKRKWIEKSVAQFNENKPSEDQIKDFIKKCKSIIDKAEILFGNPHFVICIPSEKGVAIRTDFESTRFNLPIDQIFNTGLNIVLLGEAGAGKTTSLQMYALRKQYNSDKLIIWAPLARALQLWPEYLSSDFKAKNLDEGIAKYLYHKGISITPSEFKTMLQDKSIILLLDGVDESIRSNPWLPRGIKNLAEKYGKKLQVIVTSRASGSYINEIPFFTVTLLPFTDDQRNKFIEKWFEKGNTLTVNNIKAHLENNKAISDIVKNPLLTTTLCVIAKHNIPLPNTEIKLYDDRLKLLTGYYDNVKEIITRISSTPQTLESVAQKIAYYLHANGKREENLETLIPALVRLMRSNLNEEEVTVAINELIDPCNILMPMTEDGKYGFGHLRYQEHLAAKEMLTNRSVNILPLMEQNWWRDSLTLFSQMNESLMWLSTPDVLYTLSKNKIAKETFKEMCLRQTSREQGYLMAALEKAEAENKEIYISEMLDYGDYDYDNEGL